MAEIVDEIPVPGEASWMCVVDDALYCSPPLVRVDLHTKAIHVIRNDSQCMTLVDFHRPMSAAPDVLGAGEPDRRIYVSLGSDGQIGEITLVPFIRLSTFQAVPDTAESVTIASMVGSNSGKYLYFNNFSRSEIGVIDLQADGGQRTVATIPCPSPAVSMVVSPDDRYIYAVHETVDNVSVIDTASWPPTVRTFPVANSPWGATLSADGKRLFVAQSDVEHGPTSYGGGSLSVLDTATMHGQWLYTGKTSLDVVVNTAGTRAYVSNYGDHTVSVVDVTGSPAVIDTIDGFTRPARLAFSADQTHLYVGHGDNPYSIAVVSV